MISETVVIVTWLYTQRVIVTVTDKLCHYRVFMILYFFAEDFDTS